MNECDLCDNDAAEYMDVSNEETGEKATGEFCAACVDRVERYTAGEEVEWP